MVEFEINLFANFVWRDRIFGPIVFDTIIDGIRTLCSVEHNTSVIASQSVKHVFEHFIGWKNSKEIFIQFFANISVWFFECHYVIYVAPYNRRRCHTILSCHK